MSQVPIEKRRHLRDQRNKIGPKGSLQLRSADKIAMKRDVDAGRKVKQLESQFQKHHQMNVESSANLPLDNISCTSNSGESEQVPQLKLIQYETFLEMS
jgi:hypothetical protein